MKTYTSDRSFIILRGDKMVYFIAEMTDIVNLITEDDGITALEFETPEEATQWGSENLAFDFYVLKVM